MKKLYRKSTVYPTPSVVSDHLLSFLPAAIFSLTAALSPEDREVLAYLISSSSSSSFSDSRRTSQRIGGFKGGDDHLACFNCSCFRCYTSYWRKWDESGNRQLIHEIIDAFEGGLSKESKKEKNRKDRRKGKSVKGSNTVLGFDESYSKSELSLAIEDSNFGESNTTSEGGPETGGGSVGEEEDNVVEDESDKGSVGKFVSFLGERIWGVWG